VAQAYGLWAAYGRYLVAAVTWSNWGRRVWNAAWYKFPKFQPILAAFWRYAILWVMRQAGRSLGLIFRIAIAFAIAMVSLRGMASDRLIVSTISVIVFFATPFIPKGFALKRRQQPTEPPPGNVHVELQSVGPRPRDVTRILYTELGIHDPAMDLHQRTALPVVLTPAVERSYAEAVVAKLTGVGGRASVITASDTSRSQPRMFPSG